MSGVGEQLLAGAGLADQQDGAFAGGHPGHGVPSPADGLGISKDVVKAVFGSVALLEQLAPQLTLAGFHVVEPLQQGEGADAYALPDDRHHLYAEVDAVDLHHPGGQGLAGAEAFFKGDEGKGLSAPLAQDQRRADAGHVFSPWVAGKDLTLFVDADDAVLQALH